MSFHQYKMIYFLGIGGIGMSALARYFKTTDKRVSGYDKCPTELTRQMETEDIRIHYDENIDRVTKEISDVFKSNIHSGDEAANTGKSDANLNNFSDEILVIRTPAVPDDHTELKWFRDNHFTIIKRAEALGMITRGKFTVAVAGTHGKTSVSSMIAHILNTSGCNCTAFLGGIIMNYDSNFVMSHAAGGKEIIVAEADEYDRSFLNLSPDIAVVTAMDADHLDIYGSAGNMRNAYREFAGKIKKNGVLLVRSDLAGEFFSFRDEKKGKLFTYGFSPDSDFTGIPAGKEGSGFSFRSEKMDIRNMELPVPGRHNLENATAAIAAASICGVQPDDIIKSLVSFTGVRRRFEYHIRNDNVIMIDDYAHHPEEIRALVSAVREVHPGKKITGIFQPHLYSRTRDFADDFAHVLDGMDDVILLDIYPAREKPVSGVTSALIADKMKLSGKIVINKNELMDEIRKRKVEVLLTIGAGDIDTLIPGIKKIFS
ncbi:MAG: UDP-N-acetylmuramate--L-alanine ligase [Bacteroidetes bacterium]|nr:UDP-N-acetylmuramate--L-alanine ligase [Bacteroidota bacterium]